MFRTRSRDDRTTNRSTAPRRAFRPDTDRLESREVPATFSSGLLGSAGLGSAGMFIGAGSLGTTTVAPTLGMAFNGLGGQNFVSGLRTNTGVINSPFINLPNNVNTNVLLNRGRLVTTPFGTFGGAVNPGLTSGFGVQSGLAFNNGFGGTPFGLGNNVGFNGNLFGNGLGTTNGLLFNNGLGIPGTNLFGNSLFGNNPFGNNLTATNGLAFNNGLGIPGGGVFRNGTGTLATTGLAFNQGLGGFGFQNIFGRGVTNGLTFTGGLGFNSPFNNPFNTANTTILGFGNNLNTPLTNFSAFTPGLSGLNGAGFNNGLNVLGLNNGFNSGFTNGLTIF